MNFIIFIFLFISSCQCFIPKFNRQYIKNFYQKDYSIHLNNEHNFLKNITGFYGLIGPNYDFHNVTSLMDLFTGDGVVQGVFFNKGNITFHNHIIQTEKLLFEQKHGKNKHNLFTLALSMLKIFPVPSGTANTALHQFQNQTLALYETDYPYVLHLDMDKFNISTIGKQFINKISSISAHSKFNEQTIDTIHYNILKKEVQFLTLDKKYNLIDKIKIKTKYMPVIHDFINTEKYVIFADCPLQINFKSIFNSKFPIHLNNKLPTFIHIINKQTKQIETFSMDQGIYIFHFSHFEENENSYIIQAPQLDEVDFSNLVFKPKLREININRKNKYVLNKKYSELENIHMDFPVKINSTHTIFSIVDKEVGFTGFTICENMKITKKILFENTVIIGEPQVINISNTSYIISFTEKNNQNYISFVNLKTFSQNEILIPMSIINGFHSMIVQT